MLAATATSQARLAHSRPENLDFYTIMLSGACRQPVFYVTIHELQLAPVQPDGSYGTEENQGQQDRVFTGCGAIFTSQETSHFAGRDFIGDLRLIDLSDSQAFFRPALG